jgi:hypothetical protein
MAQEKARLEELIAALQRDYLENGRVETHIYENRMKSYVSRLSEIEEQMAVAEAERSLRAGKKILAAEAKGQQSEIAAIPKPAESVQKAPRKEQAPTAIQKEKLEPLSEQAPPAIQKPAKPTTDSKQQGSPQKSASLNGKEKPSGASKGKNK